MSRLTNLLKGVCGLPTCKRIDGRVLPQSLQGFVPVAIVHDRRLSAGIFQKRRRRGYTKSPVYRLVVWRTYRTRGGTERASTQLFRDEVDPALALLAKCGENLSTS